MRDDVWLPVAARYEPRHLHRLTGTWSGSTECHVAIAGDWLVIWKTDNDLAVFQRTGSYDELSR